MFEVPESKARDKVNQFEFKVGAKKYAIPALAHASSETIEVLALLAESESAWRSKALTYEVFDAVDPAIGKVVRTLDAAQLDSLVHEWTNFGGVDAGESSGSDDS